MILPVRSPLCAAILLYLSVPAKAAQENALVTLDTLLVTHSAPSTPLTWTTDPRLPRQPLPASDGADYLKTVPGFAVIRQGGTNGDAVLRGLSGSRLNISSNDGVLIGACPARMDNPLSYIAPERYDRLTVIKGPQTVRWGPVGSAGTIRFERSTPRFDRPTLTGAASALAGSFGRNDQTLDVTGGTASGYLRLEGNRSESNDYADGRGMKVASRWLKWNSDVAVGWTPNVDTVLELSVGRGDAWTRYAGRSMDGVRFERSSYGVRFEQQSLSESWKKWSANLYYNDADHVMDNYTLRTPNPQSAMAMAMAANVNRTTQGGRIASEWRWGAVDAVAGVDLQDSRERSRSSSGRGRYRGLPWQAQARLQNAGMFSELIFGYGTSNRWVSGLRLDRAQVTDRRTDAQTYGQQRRQWLGSGFLRYERDFEAGWAGYAGLGRSARMPDYWELFSADDGPVGTINAFAGIRPEHTTQLDIGLQYHSGALDAWVSAYAGRVADDILFVYSSGGMMGSTTRVRNVDARIAGAEAGIEWWALSAWTFGATLAYAWGENRSDGGALPQMPPLESRFSVDWRGQHWFAGALLRAVTRQERVAVGEGNVVGQDLGPSAGFATLALNAGYRFSAALRLIAGIDNLFNRNYSELLNLAGSADFGYPADSVRIHEPGLSVWLKVNYTF